MAVEFDLSEVGGIAQLILLSPKQANQAAGDAGVKIGAEVKRRAQQAAPKDRPWLARSGVRVRTWRFADGSHTDVYTTADDEGRPVGFFVEYGTAGTPPDPFLSSQMVWAADAYHELVMANLEPLEGKA